MSKKHREAVQRQFTGSVEAFSKEVPRDSDEVLAERVAFARPERDDLTLDVACGPGAFVLALAPLVRFARGIDVTAAMLTQARGIQRERQIANACFDQGEAERLPYGDGAFSLSSCHFAFHHMPKPDAALKEMHRVTRTGGRLMLVDTIGPESDEKWSLHNRIEIVRDRSHTASLRLTAFLKWFDVFGLEILRQSLKRRARSFNQWMQRAGVGPSGERYREARKLIEEAIPGDRAGFSAQHQDDDLLIMHYEGTFLLKKRG